MRRIGLVLKRGENQAISLGEKINNFLHESGKEVLLEGVLHELAGKWKATATEHLTDEADLLVVLGGDGTILRAASLLNDKSMPVLGVNLGRVGFMAEISPPEAISALASVMDGTAEFVQRMLLQLTLPNGKMVRVLNEAVIHWGGIARLIDLGIKMGSSREIELRADGLIVSTPTGSSAYSYAAHGPLIHPDVQGILLTPICPYIGLRRPLMIPPDVETQLILKKGADLTLTLDGHTNIALEEGQAIRVVKAPIEFIMVKSEARDYFDVLKEKKLGLV
ncbi:MAG: NAD(+)/NADH kinase [Desulfomonile tiedjei]|uniref:NAD kinase n=1 Tax=Desulfomonile tiedjei TaxID=2358 RepID=A0A9D6UZR4_9BACT|nr:NAD(+)/NADH kinase [Desulfomonile tiedjei]